MASRVLYPPTIASSLPAFLASSNELIVPISFSRFNNYTDISSVHVSIVEKNTGKNAVNSNDNSKGHYRMAGIILNVPILESTVNGKTQYFIKIYKEDIKGQKWTIGQFYKIQVRLSSLDYSPGGTYGQQAWMNVNASYFSEWSTVCITKAIGNIKIDATNFDFTYRAGERSQTLLESNGDNLGFIGNYECTDLSETLAYYRVKLYNFPIKANNTPLEDSGYIYTNATNLNEFNYIFKTQVPDLNKYTIEVEYNTINNYNDTFKIDFNLVQTIFDDINLFLLTADNNSEMSAYTTVSQEEEEGRVGLKIYDPDDREYSGNLCIRRASSRTNFMIWEDIKIVSFKNEFINNHELIYDYTAEGGVWYKYGIQVIHSENSRSKMNFTEPILRNYEYSYLLGENNQQLKLKFDGEVSSFARTISESKTDTIGGKYAIFSRNAAMDYKTFPISGKISFLMDEQNTFITKEDLYESSDIIDLYEQYNEERNINQYDYIYEKDFRNTVSEFLYNGKPKLFKSTTEGNVLVRLMEISFSPEQSLGRMIYSFSCTAYELDDNTVDNYKKYDLLTVGEPETDFSTTELKEGQISGAVSPRENIFDLIREKYYRSNVLGIVHEVDYIKDIRIQIEEEPMRVTNNVNNIVLGYNIELNGQKITLKTNVYEIDPNVIFDKTSDTLYILNDETENAKPKVNVIIEFVYNEKSYPVIQKAVDYQFNRCGIGQIYGNFDANEDLYKQISDKYYYSWKNVFSKLSSLNSITIEAAPGAVFKLRTEMDGDEGDNHVINDTGILALVDIANFKGIKYLGKQDIDGTINEVDCDIIITYDYTSLYGGYTNA